MHKNASIVQTLFDLFKIEWEIVMFAQSDTWKTLSATIYLFDPTSIFYSVYTSLISYLTNDIAIYESRKTKVISLRHQVSFLGPQVTFVMPLVT